MLEKGELEKMELTAEEEAKVAGGAGYRTCPVCHGDCYVGTMMCSTCKGSGSIYDEAYNPFTPPYIPIVIDLGELTGNSQ